MADPVTESRLDMSLSTGVRVGALIAGVLLITAAVLLWSPIQLYPTDGFPTQCGSAAAGPSDQLGQAMCGQANAIRRWQSGAFAAAAAVVLIGSVYVFGLWRTGEHGGSENPTYP